MKDIVLQVREAIHLESAAISPQTSALIEAARLAADEVERLRAALLYVLPALRGNDLPAEQEHVERVLGLRGAVK